MPRAATDNGDPPINNGDKENVSTNGKKKTKRKRKSEDQDPHEIYDTAARTITRCVDLWCEVDRMVRIVKLVQKGEASMAGELDEDAAAQAAREETLQSLAPTLEMREHAVRTYYKIIQIVPSLQTLISDAGKATELASVYGRMNTLIKTTRSSDAARLKPYIPRYTNSPSNRPLDPPITCANGRDELGLNHKELARWLCPAEQLERFDRDSAQAIKDLASGAIPMTAGNFPALFWSGARPGDDYNKNRMYNGLFRGFFLVRIGRHIFLGPSCGVGGVGDSRNTRGCNADLHNMTTVEPEHIAYVCVQSRFAISSKAQWSQVDGQLDYFVMYRAIVSFIRGARKIWREELIKWWNKELFGDENGRRSNSQAKPEGASSESTTTTLDRMLLQMNAGSDEEVEPEADVQAGTNLPSSGTTDEARQTVTDMVIDPVLRAETIRSSTATPVRTLTARFSLSECHGQRSSSLTVVQAVSVPVSPTRSNDIATGTLPATPTPGSPLTDEEALTPLVKKKTHKTTSKGKGKKRAIEPANEENGGERSKRARRARN